MGNTALAAAFGGDGFGFGTWGGTGGTFCLGASMAETFRQQEPTPVRLTKQQVEIIRGAAVTTFASGNVIKLCGSCVDVSTRGGDIDLLVCLTNQDHLLEPNLSEQAR